MEKQNLQNNQDQESDSNSIFFMEKSPALRTHIINYLDNIIRGLVSFIFVGIGLFFLLSIILKMNFIVVFVIVFITSILITPFLSRIKLGEKALNNYEKWLNRIIKR